MKKKILYVLIPVLAFSFLTGGSALAFGGSCLSGDEAITRAEQMFANRAGWLGLSVDKIKSYWADGKSLKDIADAEGLDLEVIREKIITEKRAHMAEQLQAMVEAGVITQDQANRRLEIGGGRSWGRFGRDGTGNFGKQFGGR